MEHFVSGSTARCAGKLVNVSKSTASYFFHRLRKITCQATENEALLAGEIEVGESYFSGVRKGLREGNLRYEKQNIDGNYTRSDCP